MSDYQSREDFRLIPDFKAFAPVEVEAYLGLSNAAERQDGAIPPRYRELMSIAVALTTQCAYCIDVHTRRALAAGATREEVAEAACIAAALRAGAAMAHGSTAIKLFDEHAAKAAGVTASA